MVKTFAVIALFAISAEFVLLVVLHRLPTGYDPIRDAISDYGIGSFRVYFWAQLIAGATACTALAVSLSNLHPYVPRVVVVLLLANAGARYVMPAFPTDQGGIRFRTRKGSVHLALAVIAFGAVAAAATGTRGLFAHYATWQGAKALLDALGWVVLGGAIASALALMRLRLKAIFGSSRSAVGERESVSSP